MKNMNAEWRSKYVSSMFFGGDNKISKNSNILKAGDVTTLSYDNVFDKERKIN